MKRKLTSLLLSASLVLSAAAPVTTAYAEERANTGMQVNKTATYNEADNTFTITLDTFATGSKITTTTTEQVPTDIILVLDQSYSMGNSNINKSAGGFDPYTQNNRKNSNLYNKRTNGGSDDLYYKLSDTEYVKVSVEKTTTTNYTYTRATGNQNPKNSEYADNQNGPFYAKYSDGSYKQVTVSVQYGMFSTTYTYQVNGSTILTSSGRNERPNFSSVTADARLYTRSQTTTTTYTYSYTISGVKTVIGTATGDDTNFTAATLYYKGQAGTQTRLAALKDAVTAFKNDVATRAMGEDGTAGTADDVNHRVAMVGFADFRASNQRNDTEVLTGPGAGKLKKYNNSDSGASTDDYKNALVDMNTTAGQSNVQAGINLLAGSTMGTYSNAGLDMALEILKQNKVPEGETRNQVVVLFTDGVPGYSASTLDTTVAGDSIAVAKDIKDLGVTVYTIGVFNDASITNESTSGNNENLKANWYLNAVSSNYPNATGWNNRGTRIPNTYDEDGNLESYYLVASDTAALNNIFQMISSQVSSGGSSTTASTDTIVKDYIAPQFTLPAGANASSITVKQVPYKPQSLSSATYNASDWDYANATTATGVSVTIGTDTQSPSGAEANGSLRITGYDFAENWAGVYNNNGTRTAHGYKLQISFDVEMREGFLGGNSAYTNSEAMVYLNSTDEQAENPLMTFPRPQANIPIEEVTVTPDEMNVFLFGDITKDEMAEGTTVKVGDVELDLTKPYDADTEKIYGLEPWQTEYVDITVEYKDKDGNVIYRELNGAKDEHSGETFAASPVSSDYTDDGDYTVTVSVASKYAYDNTLPGAEAVTKTTVETGEVNVFKPEVTFSDENVYLGAAYPTLEDKDPDTVEWKHGSDVASSAMGTAPELDYEYTVDKAAGTTVINSEDDIKVTVVTKMDDTDINSYTTYLHDDDDFDGSNFGTDAQLKLHVFAPTLTYKDANVYLGGTYPNFSSDDSKVLESTVWKKGSTTATTDMGTAPTLTRVYETKTGQITDTADVNMNVTAVKVGSLDISDHVTFVHNACGNPKLSPECSALSSHKGLTGTEFKLHVFSPELTFTDKTLYYGEDFDLSTANFQSGSTTWKNGDRTAGTNATMSNTAPTLTVTYAAATADADKLSAGKINTPDGKIAIEATVKAGSADLTAKTGFKHSHTGCDSAIADHMGDASSNEAWIHVENCQLTVKKSGGNADESYIIYVKKDGVKYTEMVLHGGEEVTLYRLPVGNYTITEDTAWSWRYTASYSGDGNLTGAAKNEGSLTCTNTKNEDKWLDAFSDIVNNVKSK